MLEALNDDCRRLVLSYVPVKDIVRAERVSRSWQQEVLKYLRGVRIRIEDKQFDYEKTRGSYCRILELEALTGGLFDQVTTKLGSSIVASCCLDQCDLFTLLNNCPNLEHLVTIGLGQGSLSFYEEVFNDIKKLKQMAFKYTMDLNDDCLRKFIGNGLEELTIDTNNKVTGCCLLSLPLHLSSLSFVHCESLKLQYLVLALKRLPSLKKLKLTGLAPEIFQNAHLLMDEAPNLEELALNFDAHIELKEDIAQSIGRLSYLKRLDLSDNPNVTDEWLVAIKRGCGQLQELNFAVCFALSARAVVMLCKAVGSALTALNVADIPSMIDEHVLEVIGSCPNLKTLDVSYCPISTNFTAAAVQLCAARARPLRLRAGNTNLQRCEGLYPGLIVDYGDIDFSDDYNDYDYYNDNDYDKDSDTSS